MLCPKCNTDSAHRSHRVGLKEHLTSIAGYKPYRCRACKHRFLSQSHPATPPASPDRKGLEREISHTQGSIRWKQKKRDLLLYAAALIVFAFVLYFLTRAPKIGD